MRNSKNLILLAAHKTRPSDFDIKITYRLESSYSILFPSIYEGIPHVTDDVLSTRCLHVHGTLANFGWVYVAHGERNAHPKFFKHENAPLQKITHLVRTMRRFSRN